MARPELLRLLRSGTRAAPDKPLTTHEIFGTYTEEDLDRIGRTCSGSANTCRIFFFDLRLNDLFF
jgi:hypothetical protein